MSLRAAIANGNWSNPAIWNGGVIPGPGDIVASNNFTVTIDQNINVDTLTNTAQSIITAVPLMTSNTTPSGIVTGLGGTSAYIAFNGSLSQNSFTNANPGDFFGYEFTSPKAIDMFGFYFGGTTTTNISFQGWDGSSWVTLYTAAISGVITFTSPVIGNSIAYIKYRFLINTTGSLQMRETYLYEYLSTTAAVAGGGFILNSGITVTTTGETGLSAGSTDLITFSSSGTATINCGTGNILRPTSASAISTIKVTGGGMLSITGNLEPGSTNGTSRILHITTTAGAVVNVTGRVYGGNSNGILTDVSCTLNVIGNVLGTNTNGPVASIWFGAGGTLNVTGNIYGSEGFNNNGYGIYFNIGNLNITGNVYGGENQGVNDWGIQIVGIATVYITGNLFSGNSPSTNNFPAINCTTASYINQVGAIYAGRNSVGFVSSSSTAINLLTGPFVCNEYGFFPYQVVRMHLIPSTSSYFEFRDETTNGVLSPGAIAPATRLVSLATLVDNLAVSDVRFGTSYALGTLTGTLRMPSANQVTFGIPVDNTFGNAVLTAASVWDYLVADITTADSIGMRLKNVSTPQTTGEQLEAFLRLD
jgi:hypothetical protein